MSRLASGGAIDRNKPLDFFFDGRRYSGFAGDTLASALIANDVRVVGRSFKYHRARGIMTSGHDEPNALVTLRSGAFAEPNTRATTVELFDGLEATSQNRWPSLSFDLLAVNQLFSPLLVAGFYYKTFMWPAKLWERLYEPLIRRAAGLGRLSMLPDPDSYETAHQFCDLLVIGAGPAGLSAALSAGRAGLRVILLETDWLCGGRLNAEPYQIDDAPAVSWVATVLAELATMPRVKIMTRTTAFAGYDGREYGAIEQVSDHLQNTPKGQVRQRFWRIVAKRTLLASGATERPLVFAGNDRPGVMLASAASTYLHRFSASPGKEAVLYTTSDSGWATAGQLMRAGIHLRAVVDARLELSQFAKAFVAAHGVETFAGGLVVAAQGVPLESVEIQSQSGKSHHIKADLLAVAGGWNPSIGLASHLGDRPVWSDTIASFVPGAAPAGLTAIGSASGQFSLSDAIASGTRQAEEVAGDLGINVTPAPLPRSEDEACAVSAQWQVAAHRGKAFVDFQNDVTDHDIRIAASEGFVSVEHLKRYTTLGMATDQGKTSQVNGHALLAAATGRKIQDVGTILARPPHVPVAIGALAGHHRDEEFRPARQTPSHDWATQHGATFVDAGLWKRAQWYSGPGESDWLTTVSREVTKTRASVGICDVSTLGKIEVHGPDAGLLLDRIYVNMFSTLPIGKARYGLMLREDGFVLDDGTTTRLADDRYFVTTTTANAAKVMQHIDFARQVLWPELDVQATSVTEQWATYSVAGPRSRALLQTLLPGVDLSNETFAYMAALATEWRDRPMRLYRLSFSGELAYEISVPATYGNELIEALFAAGKAYDVTAYGTEALGVMRIEKGHAAGNELNGQTTAHDLGMGRMLSTKKDFIGRVMANRAALTDPQRPRLVGIKPIRKADRLRAGGHLLMRGARPVAANDQGFVTSAAFSPSLGSWIGLALLERGPDRHGEHVVVHDPVRGADIEVEVCHPVFIDPEGLRVRS